jgi:hypothetical protein
MASTKSSKGETAELLAAAGVALARRAWGEARERYERALAVQESAQALGGVAVANWWLDDVDAAIAARERAYVLRREQRQTIEAARVAGFLAWDYGAMRGANAWLQRARRLVEDREPSAEPAWLPLIEASFHLDTDPDTVLRLSRERRQLLARGGDGEDVFPSALDQHFRLTIPLAVAYAGRSQGASSSGNHSVACARS